MDKEIDLAAGRADRRYTSETGIWTRQPQQTEISAQASSQLITSETRQSGPTETSLFQGLVEERWDLPRRARSYQAILRYPA